MTRNALQFLTGLLAVLLAIAGSAAAQGHLLADAEARADDARADTFAYADDTTAHGDSALASEHADVASEYGVYDDGNYGDFDATATTERAGAALDADGSVAEVQEAREGGFWAWISLHASAFVAGVADVLGLEAHADAAPDARADAFVGADGVDLDATAGDVTFDGSAAGELDDATWRANAAIPDAG